LRISSKKDKKQKKKKEEEEAIFLFISLSADGRVWTFGSHTQEIRPALVIFSLAKKTHKCLPPLSLLL
jgi:hypothetical protein